MKEFVNEELITDQDRLFTFESYFLLSKNSTYEMRLVTSKNKVIEYCGTYKIYVEHKDGQSGNGYFTTNEGNVDLEFRKSYFLIFNYVYFDNDVLNYRELHFQRWQ